MEEIRAAELFRNDHLKTSRRLQERYAGNEYNSTRTAANDLENHSFEFLSLVVPRIIHENPRVVISTRNPLMSDFATVLQMTMNHWARATDVRETLLLSAYDDSFSGGPLLIKQEPEFEYDPSEPDVPFQPRIYRLSPEQFGFDPRVAYFKQSRFAFHSIIRDKESIMDEALAFPDMGWDRMAIAMLTPDEFPDAASTNNDDRSNRHRGGIVRIGPRRNQLKFYEIWVPEIAHQDAIDSGGAAVGFHGTIFTIAEEGTSGATQIREPRPYYGPSSGPYVYGGAYPVPDDPYPLAPLVATSTQSKQLNEVSKAITDATRSYKQIVFVSSQNPKAAMALAEKPHNYVVPIEGLNKDEVIPVEVGGITNQQLQQLAVMRERLDRNSGIDEARRGNVTGVSATEADIANQAGEMRLTFIQKQFATKVRDAFRTVAWYLAQDDRVAFALPGGDIFAGGQLSNPMLFEALDIDLEPLSMERISEAISQQKALLEVQILTQLAQLAMMAPGTDIEGVANDLGTALNMPELPRRLNAESLRAVAAMRAMNEAESGAPQPGGARSGGSTAGTNRPRQSKPSSALPGLQSGAKAASATRQRTPT